MLSEFLNSTAVRVAADSPLAMYEARRDSFLCCAFGSVLPSPENMWRVIQAPNIHGSRELPRAGANTGGSCWQPSFSLCEGDSMKQQEIEIFVFLA